MKALKEEDCAGVFLSEDKKSSWLQTYSGQRVSVAEPSPDNISIQDIATAISKQCRFNGHCSEFYSVAEHCVRGSKLAEKHFGKKVAKEFLMHDATEAYLGDLIKPVKVTMPFFQQVEEVFWKAIAKKFGLLVEQSEECHYLDKIMVTWEKRDLLPFSEHWPRLPDIEVFNLERLNPWNWRKAETRYLQRFTELFGEPIEA
jgi:uncharacterized protein